MCGRWSRWRTDGRMPLPGRCKYPARRVSEGQKQRSLGGGGAGGGGGGRTSSDGRGHLVWMDGRTVVGQTAGGIAGVALRAGWPFLFVPPPAVVSVLAPCVLLRSDLVGTVGRIPVDGDR